MKGKEQMEPTIIFASIGLVGLGLRYLLVKHRERKAWSAFFEDFAPREQGVIITASSLMDEKTLDFMGMTR